jgi:hypothetical protein
MKGKANSVRQKFPRSSAQWLTKNSQTIHLTFKKDFFFKALRTSTDRFIENPTCSAIDTINIFLLVFDSISELNV